MVNNQEQITQWLADFGPFVLIVYFILQAFTVIVAPIGGLVLMVAMILLYGPETAVLLSYLATTPIFLVNFLLARKYGRPLVVKVIGREPLEKLDDLTKNAGVVILILTRVLQSGNFDYLSYIWGLTKIPFKTFAMVNFLAGIPGSIMIYLVFTQIHSLFWGVVVFYILTAALAGVAIFLTKVLKEVNR